MAVDFQCKHKARCKKICNNCKRKNVCKNCTQKTFCAAGLKSCK